MGKKKNIDGDAFAMALRKRYRKALLSMGLPSSFHIYESPRFCPGFGEGDFPDARLLRFLRRTYAELPAYDRQVLLAEILEKGRYYPFWYEEWASKKEIRKRVDTLLLSIREKMKTRGIRL
ncbi:MAG: hypothetical protein II520_03610 [Bacilli bacterium]|nr:hypothetical protein [Bacilli bacterium]